MVVYVYSASKTQESLLKLSLSTHGIKYKDAEVNGSRGIILDHYDPDHYLILIRFCEVHYLYRFEGKTVLKVFYRGSRIFRAYSIHSISNFRISKRKPTQAEYILINKNYYILTDLINISILFGIFIFLKSVISIFLLDQNE